MPDTSIRHYRSVGATIGFSVLAASAGGGAIWLFTSDHWILAAIAAVFAVGFGCAAAAGSYTADCPHCGHALLPGQVNQCPSCGEFSRAERGALVKIEPDYIAEKPAFSVHIERLMALSVSGQLAWPKGCCVCGAPPTRTERITQAFDSPGVIGTRLTLRFDVPHCQSHKRGVERGGATGLELLFRSYRYYREFVRVNAIDPRRSSQAT